VLGGRGPGAREVVLAEGALKADVSAEADADASAEADGGAGGCDGADGDSGPETPECVSFAGTDGVGATSPLAGRFSPVWLASRATAATTTTPPTTPQVRA